MSRKREIGTTDIKTCAQAVAAAARHESVNERVSELRLLLLLFVENACKAARLISRLALLLLLLRRRLLLHTITNECEHGCGCGSCCRESVRSTRLTSRLALKL